MNIETFVLERWMTRWELDVDFDIAESGILPLSLAEILDLLPEDAARETERAVLGSTLGYSEARGSERLRSALAATFARADANDVLVTTGAIEANFLLFQTLVSPGDHVIAVSPSYQQLTSVPRGIGADVSLWDVRTEEGFRYDLDELERLLRPDTRLVVINSPHNPTGATLDAADLARIVELTERSGAWILADEAYRWLEHPGGRPLPPPLHDLSERAISVGTMSKSFGLPGLRLGWFVANHEIASRAWGLRDYVSLSPATLSDTIAAAVITHRDRFLPRNAAIISANLVHARDWFQRNAHLASWTEPQAGLLAMMRYHADIASANLADRLAREERVMLAPGSAFGMEGYLRLGLGQRPDIFAEGLERTARFLSELPVGSGAGTA